jgi:hypothetical protein
MPNRFEIQCTGSKASYVGFPFGAMIIKTEAGLDPELARSLTKSRVWVGRFLIRPNAKSRLAVRAAI